MVKQRNTDGKRQSGTIYILTLTMAIVMVALTMGTARIIWLARQNSRDSYQGALASNYAELGIRHALAFTHDAPTWRGLLANGVWLNDISVDQAVYSVTGIDPVDGNLAVDTGNDPVILTATATVGDVSRSVEVETQDSKTPHDLLFYGVAGGGDIAISNNAHIIGDVTANGDIDFAGSGLITGNVEVTGAINHPDQIFGTITTGTDVKTFPNSAAIVAYYTSLATAIPYQSSRYEAFLLSATNNPFGLTNIHGVYMIDCNNEKVEFGNCRIAATLILINPKSDSNFKDGLNWQPPRPDYPALIVVNNLINIDADKLLVEADFPLDFSLPGEPGFGTTSNTYPTKITGLIYCTGGLSMKKTVQIDGAIIANGLIDLRDDSIVNYTSSLVDNPPYGFYTTSLEVVPGTWRRVILP